MSGGTTISIFRIRAIVPGNTSSIEASARSRSCSRFFMSPRAVEQAMRNAAERYGHGCRADGSHAWIGGRYDPRDHRRTFGNRAGTPRGVSKSEILNVRRDMDRRTRGFRQSGTAEIGRRIERDKHPRRRSAEAECGYRTRHFRLQRAPLKERQECPLDVQGGNDGADDKIGAIRERDAANLLPLPADVGHIGTATDFDARCARA